MYNKTEQPLYTNEPLFGFFQTKDMQTKDIQTEGGGRHPQFWSGFYGRCAMCWNEWKIYFLIFAIFSFRDMVDFVLKFRKKITIK